MEFTVKYSVSTAAIHDKGMSKYCNRVFQCNMNRRTKFYLFHYTNKLELSVIPRPNFS